MKILNYALILFFSLGMFSCHSSSSDGTPPKVKFSSPKTTEAAPTVITAGQTVTFIGTVSDNKELKSITFSPIPHVKTVNNFIDDFNEKLNKEKPSSGSVLDKSKFEVKFSIETLAGAPPTDKPLTCTCTVIDKSDNVTTKTFYIKVE